MTEPTPPAEPVAASTPPAEAEAAPEPPPPAPKLVLGEAKIALKAKSKKETLEGEITLAPDGTLTATMTTMAGKKKKDTKTKTGKVTADGELFDDQNEVVAKLDDNGTVTARRVVEEKQGGKTVKSESHMDEVGVLGDDGVFTSKKDGKTFSIDDNGKIAGFPAELTVTTASPEHKKAAMFVVVGMMAASKATMDTSAVTASPAAAPTPKKK